MNSVMKSKMALLVMSWIVIAIFVASSSIISSMEVEEITDFARRGSLFDEVNIPDPETFTYTGKITRLTTLTTHASITIIGDSNFTASNGVIGGSGIVSDPYIIANLFIDGNIVNNCIQVINTTSYFLIENCTLIRATTSGLAGIALTNVLNGQLQNNECNTSYYGISLSSSSVNTLINNSCSNNQRGILLGINSSNNTLSNNICSSNSNHGIYVHQSSSNTLTKNTCISNNDNGIKVYSSSFINLTDNICGNSVHGIFVENGGDNTFAGNICYGNSQSGITLQWVDSNNFTSNRCYNNALDGINLFGSSHNAFFDNYCYGNTFAGIKLYEDSDSNTLIKNRLTNNNWGVYLLDKDSFPTNNFINNNWIWGNNGLSYDDPGFHSIGGYTGFQYDQEIYENFFFPLGNHDIDNDGLTDEQEMAIGTDPMLIDTDSDNYMDGYEYTYGSDPLDSSDYPTPPTVGITSPVSTSFNYDSVSLTYAVSDGLVTVYINGIANVTAQSSGSMISGLSDGIYNLTIIVVDQAGKIAKDIVLFSVDITPPTVGITSPVSTSYNQDSVTLIYTVSDGTVTVYINGVANITAHPSGSLISGLADDTHNIVIVTVDRAGNIGLDTVDFTIETTLTTPISTTTTAAAGSFPGSFLVFISLGTIVIIAQKRKRV